MRVTLLRSLGIALLLATVPLVVGFGICGPTFTPPPEPRGCTTPAAASEITMLEVGPADGSFAPGARATPMIGGQGFSMLGFRIAVAATGPVNCIALADGNLAVEAEGDWFVTDPTWRIADDQILVDVEGYGMHVVRMMSANPPDAGP